MSFSMPSLRDLGIEKGKPFDPTPEQEKLLIEAERVGYMMAINNAFKKRFDGARFYENRRWYVALNQFAGSDPANLRRIV